MPSYLLMPPPAFWPILTARAVETRISPSPWTQMVESRLTVVPVLQLEHATPGTGPVDEWPEADYQPQLRIVTQPAPPIVGGEEGLPGVWRFHPIFLLVR